ncbi:peptidoglycan bridge formation glycyltransferase FemA/FemB family protein [Candidatus Uhrbacteria bacterium]|nr:peptidoglycan bridge formation glycyltransferase FemA/FemB family protein [Candidatus Uhrbacteria bacterium]
MEKKIDVREWNGYIASQPHAQFLQSWEWGAFQESLGFPAHYIGTRDERGEIARCALFLELPLFGGRGYLYCPRGPVGDISDTLIERALDDCFRMRGGPLFLRYEPSPGQHIRNGRRSISIQPDREWFLDLAHTDDELSARMHPKTRYNTRLASKKNVQVMSIDGGINRLGPHVDVLYSFLSATARQKEYRLHDKPYYSSLITFFSQTGVGGCTRETPSIRLFEATYQGAIAASACIMYFGDTAYYLYGGSDHALSSTMAAFALHVFVWQDARARGYRYYNFGGIAPEGCDRHPLSGTTRFKIGFGGEHILYPGTYDMVLHYPEYMIYQVGRQFWRIFNRVNAAVV